MKYGITQSPMKLYGLKTADEKQGSFWRLDQEIMEKMPPVRVSWAQVLRRPGAVLHGRGGISGAYAGGENG